LASYESLFDVTGTATKNENNEKKSPGNNWYIILTI
jgi:hypothetical protein